jgi:hypothetical protein
MKPIAFAALLASMSPTSTLAGTIVSPIPLASSPTVPRADQAFLVTNRLTQCGFHFPALPPAQIEITGNTVRIVAFVEGNLCIPGQPYVPAYSWQVGPVMRSGVYQLEFYGYGPTPPSPQVLLARGQVFVAGVAAPTPAVVPARNGWSIIALLAFVMTAAWYASTRRD